MATFPFSQTVDDNTFIKTVCHLYRISLLKVMPVSLLLLLIYNFMRFGDVLFPKQYTHLHIQIAAFATLILLPMFGTLICIQDAIGKGNPVEYKKLFIYTVMRFLSLMGCLFSMLVFPGIVFLFCIGVYFLLAMKGLPITIILAWSALSGFLVFGAFVTKIIAPILVFTDEQNANDAVENSEQMVKGYYIRTFIFSLYAILLLFFLSKFSYMATGYFHSLKEVSPWILEAIAQVLLFIIGPWSFALLLTQKYDLQSRYAAKAPAPKPKLNIKIVEPKKESTDKSKEDKLNF
jgi:hypothetical protein